MPNPDYLGAAAWCETALRMAKHGVEACRKASLRKPVREEAEAEAAHATLALRCVRAMQALAEGRVRLAQQPDGLWDAWMAEGALCVQTAPDPLDAITMALTEAGV
jgi:hypothetical protein